MQRMADPVREDIGRGQIMLERVIFILGYGRSGSTLLDMMLGTHPDIFGAGEMSTICRHVWPNNEICSCQQGVRQCAIWSRVIGRWQEEGVDPAAHSALQKKIEPILSASRIGSTKALDAYRRQTLKLYQMTAEVTGRRVLLDSSKSPGRALALAGSGLDLRLIHLVRDPRAVAYSMSRPMPIDPTAGVQKKLHARPVLRTALRWRFVNLGAEWAMRRVSAGHGIRLRYEDLVSDPEGSFNAIGRVIDIDCEALGQHFAAGGAVAATHQVAGSRIRMSGFMRLAPDLGWQTKMADTSRAAVARVCGPQLRRYGYLDT